MGLQLDELIQFDYFKNIRLIAGKKGLSNHVSGCGILDYELDRDLNGKYAHANFLPNQLVITSLLFAKSNPFLLNEVVKYLISKDCSGLVIKNVFQLPIHDSILRYADAKGFPIFLSDRKQQFFFEDFIIQTNDCLRASERSASAENDLNYILYGSASVEERKSAAHRLLPMLRSQYAVLHIRFFSEEIPCIHMESEWFPNDVIRALYRLGSGYFLMLTQDVLTLSDQAFTEAYHSIRKKYPDCCMGLSSVFFLPEEMNLALKEAAFASAVQQIEIGRGITDTGKPMYYRDIGIYRALIPVQDHEEIQQYMHRIMEPLIEFDAKNQGSLLDTLLDLVICKGNLHLLTEKMGQHENTLRYRLGKVTEITGLNYRVPADYEELAYATRIFLLNNIRIL